MLFLTSSKEATKVEDLADLLIKIFFLYYGLTSKLIPIHKLKNSKDIGIGK